MRLRIRYKWFKPALVLLFIAVLFLQIRAAKAGEGEDGFKAANELYAKGKYQEAISAYQKLTSAGYRSAPLYFNLGNAFYRTGNISSAILYYEKAHKLDPSDEDIKMNIAIANLKTIDKVEAAPDFFLFRWWRGLILLFSLNTLAWLAVLFLLPGSLCFAAYLFAQTVRGKKLAFFSGLGLSLVSVVFLFLANRQAAYFSNNRQAIIMRSSTPVKSGPSSTYPTTFVIHPGTKVTLVSEKPGWLRVKLANDSTGWVRAQDLETI
ncbi:tetratricopeptide repeat protein [Arcticibacter sp. MXS-1]|uniref:tetratricopeptide repeat protein n=1 Tax=Arcticibacter sp. MXS-1 TaxID=3341726 RepID=UPI0035A95FE7